MLRPPEELHRFLFSSSAHFSDEIETDHYLLTPAFPNMGTRGETLQHHPGPLHRSYISFGLRIPEDKPEGKFRVLSNYDYVAQNLTSLLTVFYGKLIKNHGYSEMRGIICVPEPLTTPTPGFARPPFNSAARGATKIALRLREAAPLLGAIFCREDECVGLPSMFRAASFYQAALQNYTDDPILAFTLLLSALESTIPLFEFDDRDLIDAPVEEAIQLIEEYVPNPQKITKLIRSRMYQIRRKCALIVERTVDQEFFVGRECKEAHFALPQAGIGNRVKAAYDLRSLFLHTGKSHGVWVNALQHVNPEVCIGEPVMKDNELKKLVMKAPTLTGLERVVHYCLFRMLHDHVIDEPKR